MSDKQKTDLDAVNELISALKPNVTASDRKEAPASLPTVQLYLDGLGKDLDTGIALLKYFRERIEGRRKIINEFSE
jgi:hypothetical protein